MRNFPDRPFSVFNRLAFVVILFVPIFAQQVQAQGAQVLGPQSVIEQYDAPIVESEAPQLIDFPSMINAPGANDDLEILSSIDGLVISFVGSANAALPRTEFLTFTNGSKAESDGQDLVDNLQEALKDYLGLKLTLGDIRFIQTDITGVYMDLGYPLMSVVVPPQEIRNNELQVQINEFQLAGIELLFGDGQGTYSADKEHWSRDQLIAERLDTLFEEPVLKRESLDDQIAYLNTNPFRTAQVVFEPGEDIGDTVALIQIDEKPLKTFQAGYNNHATESSGTHRFSIGGSFGNFPVIGQQLSWNAVFGTDIDDFENYSLIYKAPNRFGHVLTLNANLSDTSSSSIPGISSASTTLQTTLDYQVPIMTGEELQWMSNVSLISKQFERASLFGDVNVGGAEFDSMQLKLNNRISWPEEFASNQFTLGLIYNLQGITSDNSNEAFRSFHNSQEGEVESHYWSLNYARVQQLSFLGSQWEGWSTETQSSLQIAGEELAGSDNFALGGSNILRAYEASEIAGDKGWYASQSLTAPAINAENLGPFAAVAQQLVVSGFVELGEARFENGGHELIWDFGFQAQMSLIKNVGCNASIAMAGKDGSRTDRHGVQALMACNWSY